MPNIYEFSPQGGDIVGSDNQIYNAVDLLGGGTPINENVYDHTQFSPRGGVIIGSDNRAYDLVDLLRNAGSGSGGSSDRAEYGVYIDGTTATACTRLGDAAEMSAAVYTVADGNDFDKVAPWVNMYLCNLDNTGKEAARYGEPGFAFDGVLPAYAYKVPVMVHIPAFWYKVVFRGAGREVWISPTARTGYSIHPAFADENGVQNVDCVYIGAKLAGTETVDDKTVLTSTSGEWSLFGVGRQTFRQYARNRGSGWEQADFDTWSALQMLYLVEFGDLNSQAALGEGISSERASEDDVATVAETGANRIIVSNTTAGYRYVGESVFIGTALWSYNAGKRRIITSIETYDESNMAIAFDGDPLDIAVGDCIWCAPRPTGDADTIGQLSGHTDQNTVNNRCQVAYRGVEGFHGNAFTNIDGCNIKDLEWFICHNPAQYADDVFDTESGYFSIGIAPSENGWVKGFMVCDNAPYAFIPGEIGGGSASYTADYYWQSSGNRAPRVGGSANSSTNDGAWYWAANSAAAFGSWYFGGRLRYKMPI